MPAVDLRRPEGLEDDHWSAITEGSGRLQRAGRQHDAQLVVGSAKELVETVAKVVVSARGVAIRNNADFGEVVTTAHRCLERQPGEGLATDPEIRTIAQAAKTIAVEVNRLRGRYGTGHGHAFVPEVTEEHTAVVVDAAMLWCRWALGRLEHLIAGAPAGLIRDLRGATFTRGVLARRLASANLAEQEPVDQHSLGVAVGRRASSGTFLVREEGVDPAIEGGDLEAWPPAYRAGAVEGSFLDERGYVAVTSTMAAKATALLAVVPDVDLVTSQLLREAGEADWSYRFEDEEKRAAVIKAMRDTVDHLPTEQARSNWLALAERFTAGPDE